MRRLDQGGRLVIGSFHPSGDRDTGRSEKTRAGAGARDETGDDAQEFASCRSHAVPSLSSVY